MGSFSKFQHPDRSPDNNQEDNSTDYQIRIF